MAAKLRAPCFSFVNAGRTVPIYTPGNSLEQLLITHQKDHSDFILPGGSNHFR
jgi:hypothetical protein